MIHFNTCIRILLAFHIALCIQAQKDQMDLLGQVKAKIASSLGRLPLYMCTETIDRVLYVRKLRNRVDACEELARGTAQMTSSDRLRLDVATTSTSGAEIYSWVGTSRFDDRDLMDMVQEGAISNGTFAAFLAAVFRNEDVSFVYNGEKVQDGRALTEFAFRVPQEKSSYRYRNRRTNSWVVTGYNGTFLVDSRTGDLARLVVRTDLLPPETAACYATTTLDYSRVRLMGIDFLLPSESRLRIGQRDGSESENRSVFLGCHEFLGESAITFDPPPDAPLPAAHPGPAPETFSIPRGLRFRVALTQEIDTATAAAGDPIQAKLVTPIGDPLKPMAPKGAAIAARIVHMQQLYGTVSSVSLAIRLETVEVGGASIPLVAVSETGSALYTTRGKTLQRRAEFGTIGHVGDRSVAFEFRHTHRPYVIPSGLESMWVTAIPKAGDSITKPRK